MSRMVGGAAREAGGCRGAPAPSPPWTRLGPSSHARRHGATRSSNAPEAPTASRSGSERRPALWEEGEQEAGVVAPARRGERSASARIDTGAAHHGHAIDTAVSDRALDHDAATPQGEGRRHLRAVAPTAREGHELRLKAADPATRAVAEDPGVRSDVPGRRCPALALPRRGVHEVVAGLAIALEQLDVPTGGGGRWAPAVAGAARAVEASTESTSRAVRRMVAPRSGERTRIGADAYPQAGRSPDDRPPPLAGRDPRTPRPASDRSSPVKAGGRAGRPWRPGARR